MVICTTTIRALRQTHQDCCGWAATCCADVAAAKPAGHAPRIFGAGAVVSIATAHVMWVLYMLSPFGPAGNVMGSLGVVDFYKSLFQ